jgi:hypothetical protein
MIVSAWKNGGSQESGTTYGLRVGIPNRKEFFRREWRVVSLIFEDAHDPIEVEVTPGFWRKCPELRSKEIKTWLARIEKLTWPKGSPPQFRMEPLTDARFAVYAIGPDEACT